MQKCSNAISWKQVKSFWQAFIKYRGQIMICYVSNVDGIIFREQTQVRIKCSDKYGKRNKDVVLDKSPPCQEQLKKIIVLDTTKAAGLEGARSSKRNPEIIIQM